MAAVDGRSPLSPDFPQTFLATAFQSSALSNSPVSGFFLLAHFVFVFLSKNCKVITFD